MGARFQSCVRVRDAEEADGGIEEETMRHVTSGIVVMGPATNGLSGWSAFRVWRVKDRQEASSGHWSARARSVPAPNLPVVDEVGELVQD
jgi:hypothetical protein